MILFAVDFGEARTGLAACDKTEMLAHPVGMIEERDFDTCVQKVAEQAKANRAEMLVVGLPKNMDGSAGGRAELCEKFGNALAEATGLPLKMWDERRTTIAATNYLNVTNTRGKKRKAVIDQVAATIILEGYMQYRKLHPDEN